MQETQHQKMLNDVAKLRGLVGKASSETVCAKLFLLLDDTYETFRVQGLFSPFRQVQYLLGLMLTTPEPSVHSELRKDEWEQAHKLLNEIYLAYAFMFWPNEHEQEASKTEAWFRPRSVAMPAFLHYFNQGSMASVEQTIARIETTLVPFDNELESRTGISASDAIRITKWIIDNAQARFDRIAAFMRFTKQHIKVAIDSGWDAETARQKAQSSPEYLEHLKTLEDRRSPQAVLLTDVQRSFGDSKGSAYWSLFVSPRQHCSEFTYPTELNPVVQRPLIGCGEGKASIVVGNMLYEGVLANLSKVLQDDEQTRQRYFKRRDGALEKQVSNLLRSLFGDAEHYLQCFEKPDSQFEHDHVIIWNRVMFVFEAKASPPPEPFRDPNKAYDRIRRAFRAETGIQRAFEQSNRLRRAFLNSETIRLYDSDGNLKRELASAELGEVYCVCVTANSHGPVAVDLSMLLEKAKEEKYPWAVNVNDLESVIYSFKRKGWGPDKFCEFLDQRQRLQGKAMTDDELEVVGAFVLHNTLEPWITRSADKIYFQNGFSRVFDEIYEEQHGGPAPKLQADGPPRFDDRQSFMKTVAEKLGARVDRFAGDDSRPFKEVNLPKRIGRNDSCPCRSGKKFKRCCYRRSND